MLELSTNDILDMLDDKETWSITVSAIYHFAQTSSGLNFVELFRHGLAKALLSEFSFPRTIDEPVEEKQACGHLSLRF